MKIEKENKHYYRINAQPTCSVFLDEHLMKKANKILYKYKQEIDELLKNNPNHLIEEKWSLAYPNGEQVSFYGTDRKPVHNATEPNFATKQVENLFFIGDSDIYSKDTEEKIQKLLLLKAKK